MPVASGSIAYLGAARFQGYWNASTNVGTGSGLAEAANGAFSTLLVDGGYHSSTSLTASAGDYWQVTGSGTTSVNGQTDWDLNDWCIYSGSAGDSGTWKKLAFEDTIASIILGDLSSSSFHMGVENDKHIIFDSGSAHSGSDNLVYDYTNNRVGIGTASPSSVLHAQLNGSGSLPSIDNDTIAIFQRNLPGYSSAAITIVGHVSGESIIKFGDTDDEDIGRIRYQHTNNSMDFFTNNSEAMTIDSSGNVGIGTTSPEHTLSVTGTLGVSAGVITSFVGNPSSLNDNITIPASTNAVMYGPITLSATKTITIPDTSALKIIDISEL
tara:strand:- start:567 stop:1541 length:975 start_codon:yes stop_codon:yes gene_type:complete